MRLTTMLLAVALWIACVIVWVIGYQIADSNQLIVLPELPGLILLVSEYNVLRMDVSMKFVPKQKDDKFSLPIGPSDLCFDRHEFIQSSFSVDRFLQDHKRKANLETMRDDLGVYLKVLRSAMIELINKDYADFVNLSSNLIGLDKAIHGIQVPLGQLKEEVLQVKITLDEAMTEVYAQLEERRRIRSKKYKLQSLASVHTLLRKLNSLLRNTDTTLAPELVERVASEYNRLQFAISKCGDDIPYSCREDAQRICNILTTSLNRMFLNSILQKNSTEIAHCLRIYVTLDKISDAEELFRKDVTGPFVNTIISESTLSNNPRGLEGVYSSLTSFIETKMKELLEITSGVSTSVVRGYDFLINSYWTEVEQRLEMHLSSIFAPGNPEIFYKRYNETMKFLTDLDVYCGTQEHIKTLHSHPQYLTFLERWNLPVYFQIRFQEIAGSFESLLSESGCVTVLEASCEFQILATATVWDCLMQCWADGVFLTQLGHRFWKLNLQLLSRYCVWIGELMQEKWPLPRSSETDVSSGVKSLRDPVPSKVEFLVLLYMDVQSLSKALPRLEEKALTRLGGLSAQNQLLLKESFCESKDMLLKQLPVLSNFIIGEVCAESIPQLRQVTDIPRLFRRTNRETPTKPCAYVAQVLVPPVAFYKSHNSSVDEEVMKQWLINTFSTITQQYYSAVSDVLTSVQKTEESLRRLKKIRDRATASPSEVKGGGDDDKIRQQLVLDVQCFSQGILELELKEENIEKLEELLALVDEARRSRTDVAK